MTGQAMTGNLKYVTVPPISAFIKTIFGGKDCFIRFIV